MRHHLLMSATAFKRDLSDYKTIMDFAEVVQSAERLKLLLMLTGRYSRRRGRACVEQLEAPAALGALSRRRGSVTPWAQIDRALGEDRSQTERCASSSLLATPNLPASPSVCRSYWIAEADDYIGA